MSIPVNVAVLDRLNCTGCQSPETIDEVTERLAFETSIGIPGMKVLRFLCARCQRATEGVG